MIGQKTRKATKMAGSVNKVILIGNLGKDPEIRISQSGKRFASFSVATSDSWKDKDTGEKQEKTEWHNVSVVSDGLVNVVEKYLHKGSKVYLEGKLQTRKWEDKGTTKYATDVVLAGFGAVLVMLDGKQSDKVAPDNSDWDLPSDDLDSEIPF